MSHTELGAYIQSELAKGVPPETIREVLVQAGWEMGDIDTAFTTTTPSTQKKGWDTKYNFLAVFFLLNAIFIFDSISNDYSDGGKLVLLIEVALLLIFLVVHSKFGKKVLSNTYAKRILIFLLILGIAGFGVCLL